MEMSTPAMVPLANRSTPASAPPGSDLPHPSHRQKDVGASRVGWRLSCGRATLACGTRFSCHS